MSARPELRSESSAALEEGASDPSHLTQRGDGEWRWRLGTLLIVLVLLGTWEMLPRMGIVQEIIVPRFTSVLTALGSLVTGETFWGHFWVTVGEMLAGFVIGSVLGFAIGVGLGTLRPLKRLTYPLVVGFQIIPKIVLAPLIITWFGYGMESKIVMAVVIALFPVVINTMVGLESVPSEARQLMRALEATRRQTFWKLSLPHAAPLIFAGVKTGLTFAVIGAIVGEFVGATEGLGYLIHAYSFQLRIDRVYAVILVLTAIGAILYFLLEWVEKRVVFWTEE